jgi:hypothetical protein
VLLALSLTVYLTRDWRRNALRIYFIGRAYLASQEVGRFLPTVDEVEILALDGEVPTGTPDSFPPDMGPNSIGAVNRQTVRGAEAEGIASIWRQIRFDRPFRPTFPPITLCHHPYYALRFRDHGKLLLETSVCWKCASYTLPVEGFGRTTWGFEAKSEPAQKLLSTLRQYAPHPANPQMRGAPAGGQLLPR